jgi:hypothetical protein
MDRCARCGESRALHVHHRRRRSQGGPDSYANQITLCHTCHAWVHAHPEDARGGGWLVSRTTDPAQVPVDHFCWPGQQVLLAGDGTVTLCSGLGGQLPPDFSS